MLICLTEIRVGNAAHEERITRIGNATYKLEWCTKTSGDYSIQVLASSTVDDVIVEEEIVGSPLTVSVLYGMDFCRSFFPLSEVCCCLIIFTYLLCWS